MSIRILPRFFNHPRYNICRIASDELAPLCKIGANVPRDDHGLNNHIQINADSYRLHNQEDVVNALLTLLSQFYNIPYFPYKNQVLEAATVLGEISYYCPGFQPTRNTMPYYIREALDNGVAIAKAEYWGGAIGAGIGWVGGTLSAATLATTLASTIAFLPLAVGIALSLLIILASARVGEKFGKCWANFFNHNPAPQEAPNFAVQPPSAYPHAAG